MRFENSGFVSFSEIVRWQPIIRYQWSMTKNQILQTNKNSPSLINILQANMNHRHYHYHCITLLHTDYIIFIHVL